MSKQLLSSSSNQRAELASSTPCQILKANPGDQVLIEVPGSTDEDYTKAVWAWVLDKKCEKGEICVVVDEDLYINRNPKYANNSVLKVPLTQCQQIIHRSSHAPVLQLVLQEGDIIESRRIDGKTTSIHFSIEEGDGISHYCVDHTGRRRLD